MPRYKVPPEEFGMEANPSGKRKEQPTVWIVANEAQVEHVTVGKKVEVLVKGKVKSIDLRDGTPPGTITIAVDSTEVYLPGEFERMADEREGEG